MRTNVLIICLLLTTLSGCSGGDESGGATELEGVAEGTTDDRMALGMNTLVFALDRPIHAEKWFNGSYAPHEPCEPPLVYSCTGNAYRYHDITDLLPPGIPVRLHAELTYDRDATNDFNLWLSTEKAYWSSYESKSEPGRITLDITLTDWDEAQLVTRAIGPSEDIPEAPYTLAASMTAEPAWVPSGLPVEVMLEPGDTLEAQGSEDVVLHIFDPEDRFVVQTNNTWTLDENGTAGAYIIRHWAEGGATFASNTTVNRHWADDGTTSTNTTVNLNAAVFAWEEGDPQPIPPTGEASWDFTVNRQPVAVGYFAKTPQNPAGGGLNPTIEAGTRTIRVEGPSGVLLESSDSNSGAFNPSSWESRTGGYADPSLVPGTYTLFVQSDARINQEIGWQVVYFERFHVPRLH